MKADLVVMGILKEERIIRFLNVQMWVIAWEVARWVKREKEGPSFSLVKSIGV